MFRSLLIVRSDELKSLDNLLSSKADAVMLDISNVPTDKAASARSPVAAAIEPLARKGKEVFVHINPISTGMSRDDIDAVTSTHLSGISVGHVESSHDVFDYGSVIKEMEEKRRIPTGHIKVIPWLETARGVVRAFEICGSSPRITAVVFGSETYARTMSIPDSSEHALAFARSSVVVAANASDIVCFDGPSTDANLGNSISAAKQMGFSGKLATSYSQIERINKSFSPSEVEINRARQIIKAYEEAERKDTAGAYVGGELADISAVRRARRLIAMVERSK
ncbi:MAG: CoA ester lyase [Dehalococcoidia bacterium]|nr:CoA ester lyase [Dehalococcoidia bacterium]